LPAIAAAERALQQAKVRFVKLGVATAFHSAIVAPAATPFREFLNTLTFWSPDKPVYANSSAAPYADEPEQIQDQLAQQIANPVRFVEQINNLYDTGIHTFVEVGPGRVLTRLVQRILKGKDVTAIALNNPAKDDVTTLYGALAQLWVSGAKLDLELLVKTRMPALTALEASTPNYTSMSDRTTRPTQTALAH
jgi:acyl transferase domain-containing protein